MIDRTRSRPGLLVSVRSAAEALAALDGGADLIDVKEPTRGPLGAADLSVMEEVVGEVAGRVPVSVALGEWCEHSASPLPKGIRFVKYGLARISDDEVRAVAHAIQMQQGPPPVLVAYADHHHAASPDPLRLVEIAVELRFSVLLIDTFDKADATLLDWLRMSSLDRIRRQLADANVALALAGALTPTLIRSLQVLQPDWFAVRGAACTGGRAGTVSAERVRELRAIIS